MEPVFSPFPLGNPAWGLGAVSLEKVNACIFCEVILPTVSVDVGVDG